MAEVSETKAVVPLTRLLAERRQDHRMTLREVAAEAGISPSTVCRVEAGQLPDVPSLMALARWLGVSLDYAMTGKEPKKCSFCADTRARIARARVVLGDTA